MHDRIALKPKALAVLRYLAERPRQLVTKEELLDRFWANMHVGDAVLKTHMAEIRRALGDALKAPRFIETAHRRGYRFIAAAGSAPVPLAAPLRSASGAAAGPPGSHFVGRETALAQLESALGQALAGRRQLVFVSGEAGIGKTALVEALRERIAHAGSAELGWGHCIEHYGAGEAYLPLLEALTRLGRKQRGLLEVLQRHAPSWLPELPGLREAAGGAEATFSASPVRRLRELTEALEVFTATQPLVLLLEDLHWADHSTLELLSYVARRSDPARLLVVGTHRRTEVLRGAHPLHAITLELARGDRCSSLELEPLREREIDLYLQARFAGHHLPPGLARVVRERTDGNPLFLVRVLDFWQQQGLLVEGAGGWQLGVELAELTRRIPESLLALIERELQRLPVVERNLLEVASVAGVEFSVTSVAAALEADPVQVEELCLSWCRSGQVLRLVESARGRAGASRCAFRHALFQQVAYERIGAVRRAQLHQRVGLQLEAEAADPLSMAPELALHFELGGDAPRAVRYLQAAGDLAMQRQVPAWRRGAFTI